MKPSRNSVTPDEPRRVESTARMRVAEPVTPAEDFDQIISKITEAEADPAVEDVVIPPLRSIMSDPEIMATFPSGVISAPDPRPWHPIADAPKDGTMIEVKAADGTEFHAIWRRTSRHNGFRWVPVGFWSSHLNREPLKAELALWRMPEGFTMPGQISA